MKRYLESLSPDDRRDFQAKAKAFCANGCKTPTHGYGKPVQVKAA